MTGRLAALVAAVGAAAAAGCYRASAGSCVVACGTGESCPDGMHCSAGLCTSGPACDSAAVPSCLACSQEATETTRCRGDTIVRCEAGSWTEVRACSGEQPVCLYGTCRACLPGSAGCREGCAQICDEGIWRPATRECLPCALPPSQRQVLAVGSSHACAILEGGVQCWGAGSSGQLGLGNRADRVPGAPGAGESDGWVDLGLGRRAIALAAGGRHTCALLDTGQVKCWGENGRGQLGLGDTSRRGDGEGPMGDALPAVDLGAGRRAVAFAAGSQHTCAVLDDGRVKCWGANENGELALLDREDRGTGPCQMGDDLPEVDLGGAPASSVAAGGLHSCAALRDGRAFCWGANEFGQVGYGPAVPYGGTGAGEVAFTEGTAPTSLEVRRLAPGFLHTCALFAAGGVRCWGMNSAGQLGLGSTERKFDPALLGDVDVGGSALDLAAGASHNCALLDDGRVKCWGLNNFGQLGLGHTANQGDNKNEAGDALGAVSLGELADGASVRATAVAAGGDHTCAVLETGRIKCWGSGAFHQLGLDDEASRGDGVGEMGDALPEVPLPGPVMRPETALGR